MPLVLLHARRRLASSRRTSGCSPTATSCASRRTTTRASRSWCSTPSESRRTRARSSRSSPGRGTPVSGRTNRRAASCSGRTRCSPARPKKTACSPCRAAASSHTGTRSLPSSSTLRATARARSSRSRPAPRCCASSCRPASSSCRARWSRWPRASRQERTATCRSVAERSKGTI